MPVDLIIDGYNLMHFAGLARATYGPGGLQRARHRLLAQLASRLTSEEAERTIVVFDAADMPAGQQREEQVRGLRIVYSPPGLEADDVIEELIAGHASPKKLVVVSSDNRLIKAIKRRKGTAFTSEAFLDELDRLRDRNPHTDLDEDEFNEKVAPQLAPEDVDAWLQEFGLDEETIEHSNPDRAAPKPDESAQPGNASARADDFSRLAELEAELRRLLEEERE